MYKYSEADMLFFIIHDFRQGTQNVACINERKLTNKAVVDGNECLSL